MELYLPQGQTGVLLLAAAGGNGAGFQRSCITTPCRVPPDPPVRCGNAMGEALALALHLNEPERRAGEPGLEHNPRECTPT